MTDILDDLLPPDPQMTSVPVTMTGASRPSSLPTHIERMVAEPAVGDRSARTAALVLACVEWGLNDGEVLGVALEHAPTRAKYGRRVEAEVGRLLGKHRGEHLHEGKPCDKAGCPNGPSWMTSAPARASSPPRPRPETPVSDDENLHDLVRVAIAGAKKRARMDGASFVFDAPEFPIPVWGRDEEVLWSQGEPVLLCGPSGVGKTTLGQQVMLGRLGLVDEVLGLPVATDDKRVLYIAADRPSQAQRSLRRMVDEDEHSEILRERLEVWRGPLPFDLTRQPEQLVVLAEDFGAGTIVIDSLKDMAAKLSDDEVGNRVNLALQQAVVAGVEVLGFHHQRKAQVGAKPKSLDDVYGSRWLTAGAGSVVLLWGQPGDAVVELTHLKQPMEAVGPLTLLHDHAKGRTTVQAGPDLWAMLQLGTGLSVAEAARALCNGSEPKPNDTARARRKLEGFVTRGRAHVVPGQQGGHGGSRPALYYPMAAEPEGGS